MEWREGIRTAYSVGWGGSNGEEEGFFLEGGRGGGGARGKIDSRMGKLIGGGDDGACMKHYYKAQTRNIIIQQRFII